MSFTIGLTANKYKDQINRICNYTSRLTEAHGVTIQVLKKPQMTKKDLLESVPLGNIFVILYFISLSAARFYTKLQSAVLTGYQRPNSWK